MPGTHAASVAGVATPTPSRHGWHGRHGWHARSVPRPCQQQALLRGPGRVPRRQRRRHQKGAHDDRRRHAHDPRLQAHRKAALKHHPDKGGDADKFKEINEAFDCLKDPEKRRFYDQVRWTSLSVHNITLAHATLDSMAKRRTRRAARVQPVAAVARPTFSTCLVAAAALVASARASLCSTCCASPWRKPTRASPGMVLCCFSLECAC